MENLRVVLWYYCSFNFFHTLLVLSSWLLGMGQNGFDLAQRKSRSKVVPLSHEKCGELGFMSSFWLG
jgi:hypothetical protein